MRSGEDHGNRKWRPRFSLRALVALVTLVCGYFGAWEITKMYGVPRKSPDGAYYHPFREGRTWDVTSPVPFVVGYEEYMLQDRKCYYAWLIYWKVKLPFETSLQ